jgi:hypothetical protein
LVVDDAIIASDAVLCAIAMWPWPEPAPPLMALLQPTVTNAAIAAAPNCFAHAVFISLSSLWSGLSGAGNLSTRLYGGEGASGFAPTDGPDRGRTVRPAT